MHTAGLALTFETKACILYLKFETAPGIYVFLWDLKQGPNNVAFVIQVQMIHVNVLYGLQFEFLHSLPKVFPFKSVFLVTCRHSISCLKAVVSVFFCYGGTVFPAVTKPAVLSVEVLKSYSY